MKTIIKKTVVAVLVITAIIFAGYKVVTIENNIKSELRAEKPLQGFNAFYFKAFMNF